MNNLLCVVVLVAMSVVSSLAQGCVGFEKILLLTPKDFVVQSSCNTFAGSNGEITITIERENFAKDVDSVECKIINVAKSQGYQVVEKSTKDIGITGAQGYYIEAKNEKLNAYYIGMIMDEDKSQVLMKVIYGEKSKAQVDRILNNISIKTEYY